MDRIVTVAGVGAVLYSVVTFVSSLASEVAGPYVRPLVDLVLMFLALLFILRWMQADRSPNA